MTAAVPPPVPLPFERLEQVYEALAAAIDRAGADKEALFLAKLALVLAQRAGEGVDFDDCVTVALRDLEQVGPEADKLIDCVSKLPRSP